MRPVVAQPDTFRIISLQAARHSGRGPGWSYKLGGIYYVKAERYIVV